MARAANDNRPEGQLIVIPDAWHGGSLWHDTYSPQDRIGAALRAMYADLLLQPLSPSLAKLIYQVRTQQEISQHGG